MIGWQCADFIRVSAEITADASIQHGGRHVFVYFWLSLEQAKRATIYYTGYGPSQQCTLVQRVLSD